MISIFANNSAGNGKVINTLGSQIKLNLNPPIMLDDRKKYELRVINANIVYCTPNVTSANNILSYTFGGYTHNIIFDTGLYALTDINIVVSLYTGIGNNGGDPNLIQFAADESTSKIYVFFSQANVIIHLGVANSIMPMLGFTGTEDMGGMIQAGWIKGNSPAQLNSLQNILIQCDITTGSYSNATISNIVAVVVPNVGSYSTIIYTPYFPIRCPVFVKKIDSITLTLYDQNGTLLDLGSNEGTQTPELWSILLTIEEVNFPTNH